MADPKPIENAELNEINVNILIDLALTHRVISQIRNVVHNSNINIDALESQYKTNKISQLLLAGELKSVCEVLDQNKFPFRVLKGPSLSQKLYGDPTERTSRDLDLIIRKEDVDMVVKLLTSSDYEVLTYFKTPKQKDAIIKNYHHLELQNRTNGILLELHWKLTSSKNFEFEKDEIWNQSGKIEYSSHKIPLLQDALQLKYLAMHGVLHGYFRLQWLHDIFLLLKDKSEDEINALFHGNITPEVRISLLTSLNMLNVIYKFPLRSDFISEINSNGAVQKLSKLALNDIVENTSLKDKKSGGFSRSMRFHRIQFFLSGFKGLIKSIFSRNVRPSNWKFFAFPDSVFFMNTLFSRLIWLLAKTQSKHR